MARYSAVRWDAGYGGIPRRFLVQLLLIQAKTSVPPMPINWCEGCPGSTKQMVPQFMVEAKYTFFIDFFDDFLSDMNRPCSNSQTFRWYSRYWNLKKKTEKTWQRKRLHCLFSSKGVEILEGNSLCVFFLKSHHVIISSDFFRFLEVGKFDLVCDST